jgi:hypothetical protein
MLGIGQILSFLGKCALVPKIGLAVPANGHIEGILGWIWRDTGA